MLETLFNLALRTNRFDSSEKVSLLLLICSVALPAVSQSPEERPDPPPSDVEAARVQEELRGHDYLYRVDVVLDGDSILLENGKELRLIGVDAPEKGDPYADAARQTVRSLVPESSIIAVDLDRQWWDRYDRLLGYVYTAVPEQDGDSKDLMLNVTLVKRGLAKAYLHERNTQYIDRFMQAQRTAVRQKRHLFDRVRETADRYVRVKHHYRVHRPGCKYVRDIPKRYKRIFHSRRQALLQGCSSATCCAP